MIKKELKIYYCKNCKYYDKQSGKCEWWSSKEHTAYNIEDGFCNMGDYEKGGVTHEVD